MNIDVREESGARIIALNGRLELTTGKELKEKIKVFTIHQQTFEAGQTSKLHFSLLTEDTNVIYICVHMKQN